jgi:hypothetical protein
MKTAKDIMDPIISQWFDAGALIEILEGAGFVIVPREPTQEMLDSCGNGECRKWAPGAWLNMIEAAVARS